jgi:hypothetical protein
LAPIWSYAGGYYPDVTVIQKLGKEPTYDYELVIHKNRAGDVLTEQVYTPDQQQIVYVHDPDNPSRIVERHEIGPEGSQEMRIDPTGRKIRRMEIDSPVRITTHTVDDDDEIISSKVRYAEGA